jgi:ketosteroid isomerase-like protein
MTFVLLLIAACAQKKVQDPNKRLADSLTSITDSVLNSCDFNKVAGIYAADALLISCGKKYSGKDSIISILKNSVSFIKNLKTYPCVYSASDKLVFIQSYFTFNWNKDNHSTPNKGTTLSIWQKQADNTWKITFFQEDHY